MAQLADFAITAMAVKHSICKSLAEMASLCLAVHHAQVYSQILEGSITSKVKPAKIPSLPTCPKRLVKEDNRSTFRSEVKC